MKKTLSLLLVLVLLLSLCACGKDDTQTTDPSTNPSQATTDNTEKPTDGTEGTTGATQAPTDEPTTAPTDEPTTPPTQAPTEAPTTPPTTCSHSWNAATCTAPKTCNKCGTTEGNAAGHNWSDATCTAPKTCKTCKATEGNAAGHSWNAATCTAPKTCAKCGATEGSAAGHSWKDATCTAPKTCTKCGATEGGTAAHTLTAICTVCGGTNAEYVDISAGEWGYIKEYTSGQVALYFYAFEENYASYAVEYYIPLESLAAEQGKDIATLKAEYEAYGLLKVINGKNYAYDGSGFGFESITYTEENGVLTLQVVEEGWSQEEGDYVHNKTATLTRTGFAEFTVTGGDYFEVGLKLTPME